MREAILMKTKLIALTLAATLLVAPAAYAHGGHHGAHHSAQQSQIAPSYTCQGQPAHQHTDGTCPYADSQSCQAAADCARILEEGTAVKQVIRHCQHVFYLPMNDRCAYALEAAALPLD